MSRRKEPAIPNELLDQLLAGGNAGAALAQGRLLDALKKALNRSEKQWKMPPREWTMAKAQFAVIFGERFIRAMAA